MTAADPKPAPLVPPETNLQSVPSMLLDVQRFRDSGLATEADPAGAFFAVTLWCVSWHQVPAGSLPSNDIALARLAGFGRDLAGWARVSETALRGYVLCDDGRLYHPVVCSKALEQWITHLNYRKRSAAGNMGRHGRYYDPADFESQVMRARECQRTLANRFGIKIEIPPPPQKELPLPPPEPPAPAVPPAPPADPPPPDKAKKPRVTKKPIAVFGEGGYGSPGFKLFWETYPKRTGKQAAWELWQSMQLEEFASIIVDDIKNRIKNCYQWREVQFVRDPERYLKKNRWNDQIVPYPSGGRRAEIEDANQHTATNWADGAGDPDGR